MTVKKIITGGCSFSIANTKQTETWAGSLEQNLPKFSYRHTGYHAQGQELIQKKISIALIEELENYKPEELLVIVMWSGIERKAFYIDNVSIVDDLVNTWIKNKSFGMVDQFLNLYNYIPTEDIRQISDNGFIYNRNGGWYSCQQNFRDHSLTKEYFNSYETDIGPTTISLENMVFLQNLCKVKNVRFFQMYYMDNVFKTLYDNRENLNVKYLYNQLDHDTILSTVGMYDYLKNKKDMNLFTEDKLHPSPSGAKLFIDEVLIPKLIEKGVFN